MTEVGLLNAIRLQPDEDTARLVYADFLDESGTPANAALAEFIRLQIHLARLSEVDEERPALEDRENELLREHERDWLGKLSSPIARGLLQWNFERGLLDRIRIDTYTLTIHGKKLFDRHPIHRVKLDRIDRGKTPNSARLAACEWWSRVRELTVTEPSHTQSQIAEHVLVSPHLANLRDLELDAHNNIEHANHALNNVASSTSFDKLDSLALHNWRGDVNRLCETLDKSNIRTLGISGTTFTTKTLEALLKSDFAARSQSLSLKDGSLNGSLWNALNAKSVKPAITRMSFTGASRNNLNLNLPVLLNAKATARLEELDLSETAQTSKTISELANTDFLRRAVAIGLTRCTVTAKTMAALAKSEAPRLRKLTLGETGLRDAGIRALCKATWADNITHLDIMRNRLTDDALIAMADSGRFLNVRRMDLRVNSPDLDRATRVTEAITDKGVIALANAPNFARLRELNLYRTRVTSAGVEALLNSPYCQLTKLDIGGDYEELDSSVVKVIAESPRLARMTRLALSFTPVLSGDVMLPLAESPYLSPLCHVDIRYNNASDRVNEAFVRRLSRRLQHYPAVGTW